MQNNLIEIKNLSVEYKAQGALKKQKNVFAVNDLSLDIKEGEILSIAGESGCGKSTLAKAILRLVDTKSGEVLVADKNVLKFNKKELKKCIAMEQLVKKQLIRKPVPGIVSIYGGYKNF